jgi:Asp/Glu/hydantoin racemase
MPKRVALIHTVTSLVNVFQKLCEEVKLNAETYNVVDESLLQNVVREGRLSPVSARRVVDHILSAELAGADLVMCTCSSIGPAVEMARPLLTIPALRVDEPMAERAVQIGRGQSSCIGVAATLRTTLEPTADLIKRMGARTGDRVEVITELCEGAFAAVIAGDTQTHDAIVSEGLGRLSDRADVIVLAQASMARVADQLPGNGLGVPVLSSPRLAVKHLADVIDTL